MVALGLSQASVIVDAALAHARSSGFAPMTVAVLDPGGHVVALKREDSSGILRVEVAVGKAWGVLAMGWPGREALRRAEGMPQFLSAVTTLAGGRLLPVAGGVPVRADGNDVIGAVGVSGDTSDNDEACAVAGIEAAGLHAWL